MPDARIWRPDASCRFWQWNTARASTGGRIGQFRIPSDSIGVLAYWNVNSSTAFDKNVVRVVLLDTFTSDAVAPVSGLSTRGAIQDSQELGADGLDYNGFCVQTDSSPRPCAIELHSGLWIVYQIGSSGAAVLQSLFGGWVRPANA